MIGQDSPAALRHGSRRRATVIAGHADRPDHTGMPIDHGRVHA
jgi:hypothetical protein